MDIANARRLKPGDFVRCPPDRGDEGYTGPVTLLQPGIEPQRNAAGIEYISVHVRTPRGHDTVWPSNRLG